MLWRASSYVGRVGHGRQLLALLGVITIKIVTDSFFASLSCFVFNPVRRQLTSKSPAASSLIRRSAFGIKPTIALACCHVSN